MAKTEKKNNEIKQKRSDFCQQTCWRQIFEQILRNRKQIINFYEKTIVAYVWLIYEVKQQSIYKTETPYSLHELQLFNLF